MKRIELVFTNNMLVRKYVIALLIVVTIGVCWGQTAAPPQKGDGSEDNPYEIATLGNLKWVQVGASRWKYHYVQTADINASGTSEWSPIGTEKNKFTGSYDGNGFTISGLHISKADNYIGLFGYTIGATIKNVRLVNVTITGSSQVGGLLGNAEESTQILNCFVSGMVKGTTLVGGLVGRAANSTTISQCVSTGNCSGTSGVGGLVGQLLGTLTNSYSTVGVEGEGQYIGGLVGTNTGVITKCYSTGTVSSDTDENVGGLVGKNAGTVNFSYWDTVASEMASSDGGLGRTTEDMTFPYTDNTFVGWDFNDTWVEDERLAMNGGYPYLSFQADVVDPTGGPAAMYEGIANGFKVVFTPSADETEYVIIIPTVSTEPDNPAISGFSNPQSIGAYYKFAVDKGEVFRSGVLQLSFESEPNQLWFRNGEGSWMLMQKGEGGDWEWDDSKSMVIITAIDILSLRGDEIFEYAGDNGQEGVTLPVELSSFTASLTSEMTVQLTWIAETETNLIGYNVFRCNNSVLTDAEKINSIIIPAHNGSSGNTYRFNDLGVDSGNTYYYWLQSLELDLSCQFYGPVSMTVEEEEDGGTGIVTPIHTELRKVVPNPFNPGTSVVFSISEQAAITIKIYNAKGQFVRTLVENKGYEKGAEYRLFWDGKDYQGRELASGLYFCIMNTNDGRRYTKRMVLMK